MTAQEEIDQRLWDSIKQFTKDKNIVMKYPIASEFNTKEQLSDIVVHRPVKINDEEFTIKFPKQRESNEKNIIEYSFTFDYDAFNFSDGNALVTTDFKPKQIIRSFLQHWRKAMAIDEQSLIKVELNVVDVLAERLKRVQEQLRGMRVALINQEHRCYMFLGDEKHHSVAKLNRIKQRLKKYLEKLPSWRIDNRLWMDYQDLVFLVYLTKRYYFLKFEEQRLKKQRDKQFERIYRTNPFR